MADTWDVTFNLTTLWPTDVPNPEGFEGVEWVKIGRMPFVPVAGMMLDCGDGDMRAVHEVFWSAAAPNCFGVHFEDDIDEALPREYWDRGGWKSEDLGAPAGVMPARAKAVCNA
jgi:hypothetical protein